jgi:hypothetical protein
MFKSNATARQRILFYGNIQDAGCQQLLRFFENRGHQIVIDAPTESWKEINPTHAIYYSQMYQRIDDRHRVDYVYSPVTLAHRCESEDIHMTYIDTNQSATDTCESLPARFLASMKRVLCVCIGTLLDVTNIQTVVSVSNNQTDAYTIVHDLFPCLVDMVERKQTGELSLVNPGTLNMQDAIEMYTLYVNVPSMPISNEKDRRNTLPSINTDRLVQLYPKVKNIHDAFRELCINAGFFQTLKAANISIADIDKEETRKKLYGAMLQRISKPPPEKCVWSTQRCRLALCIVEPRQHEWLAPVLYNAAHYYGGRDVSLYIFHGLNNREYVEDIVKDWEGVQMIGVNADNLPIPDYNWLLTRPHFWSTFDSEYVLIFQTDSLCNKPIPEQLLDRGYEYNGAPWKWTPTRNGLRIGNGGFSLRLVKRMEEICVSDPYTDNRIPEDVWFADRLHLGRVPSLEEARAFSMEHIWHDDPIGCHQIWRFHPIEQLYSFLCQLIAKEQCV